MPEHTPAPQAPSADRRGLLAAGHWIADLIRRIDHYPAEEDLAHIHGELIGNGGGCFNVLANLSRMQCGFPLEGIGLIGDDANADFVEKLCDDLGIAHPQLRRTAQAPTSYTLVMNAIETGRRTFFHNGGANRLLEARHCDLRAGSARIFYLGYVTMLDKMDRLEPDGGNPAAHLLQEAAERGFLTAVDLVSAPRKDFAHILAPVLPRVDYLFCNEREAAMALDRLPGSEEAALQPAALSELASQLLQRGVRRGVILHCARGVVYLAPGEEPRVQAAVRVPPEAVAGTAGAGDALAAGFLLGLHEELPLETTLELAVCAAAQSLGHETCSQSLVPWKECLENGRAWGYQDF